MFGRAHRRRPCLKCQYLPGEGSELLGCDCPRPVLVSGNSHPGLGIQSWIRSGCVVIPVHRAHRVLQSSTTPTAPRCVIWCVGLYGCERSTRECGNACRELRPNPLLCPAKPAALPSDPTVPGQTRCSACGSYSADLLRCGLRCPQVSWSPGQSIP